MTHQGKTSMEEYFWQSFINDPHTSRYLRTDVFILLGMVKAWLSISPEKEQILVTKNTGSGPQYLNLNELISWVTSWVNLDKFLKLFVPQFL